MAFTFFVDFYTHSTFREKKFILTIAIMYGLIAPSLIGFAIWFKAPTYLCRESVSNAYYDCYEKDFCKNETPLLVTINEASSPSLAATLGLICDSKKTLLQSYFLGGILGCLANILIPISADKRKMALVFFGLVQALANFSVIFTYESNIAYLQFSFGLIAFSLMIMHANCPLIINEAFVGDLAKAATSMLLMGWGIMGLIYVVFAFFNDADFHRCFAFIGFINLANSLHLILQQEPEVHLELNKKQSVLSLIKDVFHEKHIGFNIIAYVLGWASFAVTYNQVNLKLGAIGGNVYLNLLTFSIMEVSVTFVASSVASNFKKNLKEVINYIMIFESLLCAGFYFAPYDIAADFPAWKTYLLLFLMACVKFCSDLVNNLISIFAQKIFSVRYVKLYLAFSRLLSRLLLFEIPVINIFFEKMGYHPLLFASLCWMICSVLALNVQMPETDTITRRALERRRSSSRELKVLVEDGSPLKKMKSQ